MNSIPPKINDEPLLVEATRGNVRPAAKNSAPSLGFFVAIVLSAAFLGASVMVYFFNPSHYGFYPVCMFHQLTGLNCPGCGGTRSLYALLHGHLQAAFKDNALFIFCLGAMTVRGIWFAHRKMSGKPAGPFFLAKQLWPLLVIAIAFTVMRNLSMFSFLSP